MWHDYALIRLFHYTHLKLQLYHRNVCFYFLLPQKISELFWMTCVESLRLGNDTVTDTVVDWSWNYMQIIPFLAPATRLQRLGTYVKLSQSFRRPQNFQLWSELRKITHDGTIRCLGIELSRTWDGTALEVVVLTITSIYIYRLWMPETHILRCGVVFSIDLDSRSHDRVEKQFRSFRDTFFFHNHIMNLANIIIFYSHYS